MTRASKPSGPGACPICGRPPLPQFRPFCSARCADVDLGRWFTESYAVSVSASDEDGSTDGGPERVREHDD